MNQFGRVSVTILLFRTVFCFVGGGGSDEGGGVPKKSLSGKLPGLHRDRKGLLWIG